jgi:ABC-2 type transport system permease protein
MNTRLAVVSFALARRAVRNAFRRPQFLAPLVIFPSLFLAVNVGGLHRSTQLPGFPHVHGFLDFQLAAAITQSLLLGGISQGIAAALDVEGGFFDRLAAAPIPRVAIVLGRLGAAAVIATVQVSYFLILGLVFGAHIAGGVGGAALVLLIGVVAGIGFGGLGIALALRARSASTLQGIFPLIFVILFLSTAFFPRNLLESPIDTVARYNPLSYLADGLRNPIIHDVATRPVLEGLAAGVGITLFAVAIAVVALRGRLREA